MKRFGPGWFRESYRHSLAARGILTSKLRRSYAGLDPNDKKWMADLQSGVLDADVLSEEEGMLRFEIRNALRQKNPEGMYRLIELSDKIRNKEDWMMAVQTYPEMIDLLPSEFNRADFKEAWIKGVEGKPDFYKKYVSLYGFNKDDPVLRDFLASPNGVAFAEKMVSEGQISRFSQSDWDEIVKKNPRLAAFSPYSTFEEKKRAVEMDPSLVMSRFAGLKGYDNYSALVNAAVDADPTLMANDELHKYISSDRWIKVIDLNPNAAEFYTGEDPVVLDKIVSVKPGLIYKYRDAPESVWEKALSQPGIEMDPGVVDEKYYDKYIKSQEMGLDPAGFSEKNAALMRIHNQDLFNLAYYVNQNGGRVTKQQVESIAAALKDKNPEGWRALTNKKAVSDFLNDQRGTITVADIMRFDKSHPEYHAEQGALPLIGTFHESGVTPLEMRQVIPEMLDPFANFNARSEVTYGFSRYSGGPRINPNSNITFQLNWKKDKMDKLNELLGKFGAQPDEINSAVKRGLREYNRGHPTSIKGDVTLAMMRLYPMKDSIYIEEVQSDVEGKNIPTQDFENAAFRMFQKEVMSKAPNVRRIIFPGSEFKGLAYGNRGLTFYDRIAEKNKMRLLPVNEKMEFFRQLEKDNPRNFSIEKLKRNIADDLARGMKIHDKVEDIPIYYKDVDAARKGLYALKVVK